MMHPYFGYSPMPKKFFRRVSPNPETFKQNKHLRVLGDHLHLNCLWHLHRHTIARSIAIAFFVMWLPLPFHVLMVAVAAVVWRAHLPIALLVVFINNPFTMIPMYYMDYWVGKTLLGGHYHAFKFEPSLHWLMHGLPHIWQPLAFGTLVLATMSAVIGYYTLLCGWRWYVLYQWRRRGVRHHCSREANV